MRQTDRIRAFECDVCRHLVFFENTSCLTCGATLGFAPQQGAVVALEARDDRFRIIGEEGLTRWRRCPNSDIAACNWLVPDSAALGDLCESCRLTRTRPAGDDQAGMVAFAKAEAAKRRVVFQLRELAIPIVSRHEDPRSGLAFDLLSSTTGPVTTGHSSGIVTLDLAESDDAYHEATRNYLGEPYRTLLGHFRHEIGHYYWMVLIQGGPYQDQFRALFGDDRVNYRAAIDRHYAEGPPSTVGRSYADVSAYATMHPWEDWAETFAHYLHIRDTLQTAAAYGVLITGPIDERKGHRDLELAAVPSEVTGADGVDGFSAIFQEWLPLTYALNAVNRSMGRDDLYPFVLAPAVVEKLTFVHQRVAQAAAASRAQLAAT